MELYIGGISQGKLKYVCNKKKILKDSTDICDGAVCSMEEVFSKKIINHFHLFIKRFFTEGMYPDFNYLTEISMDYTTDNVMDPHFKAAVFMEELIVKNPSVFIICNEVGYGIVPVDKADRIYRETVGRCLCRLAEFSASVERIVCGLGMKIK